MHSLLLASLSEYRWLGYLVVFLGAMIEGDVFLFTAFFLAHSHLFDVGDLAFFAFTGTFLGDLGWYALGYKPFRFLDKMYPWVERITQPFVGHIQKRLFHTITVSKFTYGVHHAILIRAGMLKISVRQFIQDDIVAIIIWGLVVGSLGYFSGYSFLLIHHYLRYAEIGLLFALVAFYFISHLLSRWSRREL